MRVPIRFNIDCNTMLLQIYPPERRGRRFELATITDYLDLLVDSGVGTVILNGNGQSPWYPSERIPPVHAGYTRGDREFVRGQYPPIGGDFPEEKFIAITDQVMGSLNALLDLDEDGIDWFAAGARHLRGRGATPWASVRMNDAHGSNSWEKSFFNCELQKDPRYRLSGRGYNFRDEPTHIFQLLDYRHPEVRDYYLELIRDCLVDREYDGLELDWMRMPLCCEPPVDAESLAAMHDFFTQVRAIADARGEQIGRHVPVTVRGPARLGFLRQIGLDLPAVAEAGLIDGYAPGNFFQASWDLSYDDIRAQFPAGFDLIGVMESTPTWVPARSESGDYQGPRQLPASPALIRGNVAGKLAAGCDSIEIFNFFAADEYRSGRNPDASKRQGRYDVLRDVTDSAQLAAARLAYTLPNQMGPWDTPLFEGAEQLPRTIQPGHRASFRLTMLRQPDATVQVDVGTDAPAPLSMSLNASWPSLDSEPVTALLEPVGICTHHAFPAQRFGFPAGLLLAGWNTVEVYNIGDEPVVVRSLDLLTTPPGA